MRKSFLNLIQWSVAMVMLCGLCSCRPRQNPAPPPPKEEEKVVPSPPHPDPTPEPPPGKTEKILELTVGAMESNTFVLDGYEIAYEQF